MFYSIVYGHNDDDDDDDDDDKVLRGLVSREFEYNGALSLGEKKVRFVISPSHFLPLS